MAWIETTPIADAQGNLKSSYDAAIKRSGGVAHIVRVMSPNPQTLRASMGFYQVVMFGESPLSRSLRELLATVVSRMNNCHY